VKERDQSLLSRITDFTRPVNLIPVLC